MNDFLKRAEELFEEMIMNRRYIHENAEVGMELPKTVEYITRELKSYGYEPQIISGGITCTVGRGDKVLLLRADMDALPQEEVSGLPFSCTTGACHSCGHDFHSTMLLGAAKMLKEREDELKSVIKFIFQPGEEVLIGAKKMIEAGVLENPKVDYAMAIHCFQGPTGMLKYNYVSTRGASVFKINVKGKSCHGARPYEGVSAAITASEILLSAQKIVPTEIEKSNGDLLVFGRISAGTASNIVPGEAELEGAIRSYSNENIEFLKNRLKENAEYIAKSNRATTEIVFNPEVGALNNNKKLVDEFKEYLSDVSDNVEERFNDPGTEDFATYGMMVPSLLINVGAGSEEEGYIWGGHNPHRVMNEEALITGAAVYANCAFRWAQKY